MKKFILLFKDLIVITKIREMKASLLQNSSLTQQIKLLNYFFLSYEVTEEERGQLGFYKVIL